MKNKIKYGRFFQENFLIVTFSNKKRKKILIRTSKKETINKHFENYLSKPKPKFYEDIEICILSLKDKYKDKVYKKDELGRNKKVVLDDDKFIIHKIKPYWSELKIYFHNEKKYFKYDELIEYLLTYNDLTQIFTLNNKVIVQYEDNFQIFMLKNKTLSNKLFNLIKSDLIKLNKGNFLFVKDISTWQRVMLYNILEEKGYKRRFLFKHC